MISVMLINGRFGEREGIVKVMDGGEKEVGESELKWSELSAFNKLFCLLLLGRKNLGSLRSCLQHVKRVSVQEVSRLRGQTRRERKESKGRRRLARITQVDRLLFGGFSKPESDESESQKIIYGARAMEQNIIQES